MLAFRARAFAPALAAIVLAVAGPAVADTTYTSSADFAAATSGLVTEDYTSYDAGTVIAEGGQLGDLIYGFNTGANQGGIISDVYNSFNGTSLSANQGDPGLDGSDFFFGGEGFTITLPYAVRAFGLFGNVNLGTTLSIAIPTGSAFTLVSSYDTSTFGFVGITSDTAFTSVTFLTDNSANVTAVQYGALVPEPSQWALMMLGFAGMGLSLRRARTARPQPLRVCVS